MLKIDTKIKIDLYAENHCHLKSWISVTFKHLKISLILKSYWLHSIRIFKSSLAEGLVALQALEFGSTKCWVD